MGLQTEHVYTCRGRQRAVFLRPECVRVRFGVALTDGDHGCVEVSYDPPEHIRTGRGEWLPFEGGLGGAVECATALRLNLSRMDGWAKLFVEQELQATGDRF